MERKQRQPGLRKNPIKTIRHGGRYIMVGERTCRIGARLEGASIERETYKQIWSHLHGCDHSARTL